MDISKLYNLPTDEKLRIVTALWDNIADSSEPIELPPSVIAEIERRRAEIDADPSIEIDGDEMWRRVDEARKNRAKSDG